MKTLQSGPFLIGVYDNGYKPTSIILDAPIEIEQGPGQDIWKPENYEKEHSAGPSTLRQLSWMPIGSVHRQSHSSEASRRRRISGSCRHKHTNLYCYIKDLRRVAARYGSLLDTPGDND